MKKLLCASLLASMAMAALPVTAVAAPITRQFTFSSTSGALQFGPTLGSFTYDSSTVPVGGGFVAALGLFSMIDVTFGAFHFDQTTANSGWLQFDGLGNLLEAHFGNNCGVGSCGINGGQQQWWIRVGQQGFSVNDFGYSGFNGESGFQFTYANQLLAANGVPAPSVLALLGLALAGAGLARRQRSNQA